MPRGVIVDPPASVGKLRPVDPPRNKLWFSVPDEDNHLYPEDTEVEFDRDPGKPPKRDPKNNKDYYWAKNVKKE